MTQDRRNAAEPRQVITRSALSRMLAMKRGFARTVLFAEQALPKLMPPLGLALIFLSVVWFGLFRIAPLWLHGLLVLGFVVGILALSLPLLRLRWPDSSEADRLLEDRNHLPHQAIRVQDDAPATNSPFAAALWKEHTARMARLIGPLETGLPRPDIARFDPWALRAVPVLVVSIAFAYSFSNRAGSLVDVITLPTEAVAAPDLRIDAWVTPPAYTGRAPVFLTAQEDVAVTGSDRPTLTIPQFSELTVRLTGTTDGTAVSYLDEGATAPVEIPLAEQKTEGQPAATPAATSATATGQGAETRLLKIVRNGTLSVGNERWTFAVTPDSVPDIAFERAPQTTVNAALEIAFLAKDDYGLQEAWAEIRPIEEVDAEARALYPAPEYRLDLPRRNARDAKGLTSRNLSEHPMAGKPVRLTLVARDAAGQEGRSAPQDIVLPARRFFEPLAASVAEQRQIFALDTRRIGRAIELNDAVTSLPEETIPNTTHYLLLKSARNRLALARSDDDLRATADYFWEVALGIEDGGLSLAERRLRDAQQALSEALENGASDEEIARLMDEMRQAMQEFMQALAEQAMKNPQMAANPDQNNAMRQQDLQKMMDQIENLAKSGARDQARQMLSEMQRMMNNLQAGRMPQQQQGGQQNDEMRKQMDKLGELMQRQQQLMDQTFQFDQALRDRMQRGDPLQGEDEELFGQEMPQEPGQQQQGENGEQPGPMDQMTEEQLREALKQLQAQQQALEQQLSELQKGLEGMGIKPGKGFGTAQSEMKGAAGALGQGEGESAVGSQGRALQALRDGAQDMMNQMQGQGPGPGQGPGQGVPQFGQNGRDPLGRRQQNAGPDFGEQVKVPDEIDTQRAREILEEIRRKLGTSASPEAERQYLERLLDIR